MDPEDPAMDGLMRQWFNNRGFELEKFMSTRFAFHRSQPTVTLDVYRSRILHQFGKIITQKLVVYLDLKYWINLRKVFLDELVDANYHLLYELLSNEVARGAMICPLSYWMFEELLKQSDLASRKATAILIDKFSDGVAYMPHGELVGQEILHFMRKVTPEYKYTKQWPIRECIFTRTASFLGDSIPIWGNEIPADAQLLVQKYMEDMHFFIPLEHLVDAFSTFGTESVKRPYNVQEMNQRKQEVRKSHKSFKSLFLAEIMHNARENEDHWDEVVKYLYYLKTGETVAKEVESSDEDKRVTRNLIYWSFKKNKVTNELPSYQIRAALFAASCWDGPKQMTDNDLFDYYHAQVGIPYSDVFLTETALKTLVCSPQLKLDSIYDTKVIAEPAEAIDYLQAKAKTTTAQTYVPILKELFDDVQ